MNKNIGSRILILSYFDQVEGPKIFYSKIKFKPLTNNLLELILISCDKENPLPIAFERFQIMNYRFCIPSKFARGKNEEFLITYVINEPSTENLRSLKFKTTILKEYAHELKNLKELPKILYEKREYRKKLTDLWSSKFKKDFLEILDRYESRLALPSVGKPQKEDILTLKINIKPEILIYILHSFFFRKRILILVEKNLSYLIPLLNNFIDYIFQNSFTGDIMIKTKSQYKKKREFFEEYTIMNKKQVINDTHRLIEMNHLKYEREIVRSFYNNYNSSIDDVKEKLEGIYILSRQIYNFFERNDNSEPMTPRDVIKHLSDALSVKKIKKGYLYYLSDIVRAYFGSGIVWRWVSIGEKIDSMWKASASDSI
ncbi:MAG: hypothetical protein ACFFCV_11695 [Promethearchaeota archaeon]